MKTKVTPQSEITFEAAMGATLYTMVKEMQAAGISSPESFKLAAALVIENTLGDGAIRDLVTHPTYFRWKATLREVVARGIADFEEPREGTVDRVVDHVSEVCDLP